MQSQQGVAVLLDIWLIFPMKVRVLESPWMLQVAFYHGTRQAWVNGRTSDLTQQLPRLQAALCTARKLRPRHL